MLKVELTEAGKQLLVEALTKENAQRIRLLLSVQEFSLPFPTLHVPMTDEIICLDYSTNYLTLHMGPHYIWKAAEVN